MTFSKPSYTNIQKGLFFTHCIYCGRFVWKKKKNLCSNRYGDVFYYCPVCQANGKKAHEIYQKK